MDQTVPMVAPMRLFSLSGNPGLRDAQIKCLQARLSDEPMYPTTIFHPGGVEKDFYGHEQVVSRLLQPGYEFLWQMGLFRDELKDRVDRALQGNGQVIVLVPIGTKPTVEDFFLRRARRFERQRLKVGVIQ